jgi:hypothetical protein
MGRHIPASAARAGRSQFSQMRIFMRNFHTAGNFAIAKVNFRVFSQLASRVKGRLRGVNCARFRKVRAYTPAVENGKNLRIA